MSPLVHDQPGSRAAGVLLLPHRTTVTTIIVADSYYEEHVATTLGLLPDWIDWCIDRSGFTGAPADRARAEAARAARDKRPKDDRPFRVPE